MSVRTFIAKKDNNSRNVSGKKTGKGTAETLAVGRAGDYRYKGYIEYDLDWDNVGEIVSATLNFVTTDDYFPNGAGPDAQAQVHRATKEWDEGGSSWSSGDYVSAPVASGRRWRSESIPQVVGTRFTIGCLDLVMQWAPPHVTKFGTQTKGKGRKNHGLRLTSIFQDRSNAQFEVASSENPTSNKRPTLVIDFVPKRTDPIHTRLDPDGATATSTPDFQVSFSDPNADDLLSYVDVRLRKKGSSSQWKLNRKATPSERASGLATVNVAEILPVGVKLKEESVTHYEWRARVKDSEGNWSELDGTWREFWVTNTSPSVSVTHPAMGSFRTLDNVYLEADWLDPDGDAVVAIRIQVRAFTDPADPVWNDSLTGLFWESGVLSPSAEEANSSHVKRLYGGDALPVGSYSWRVQVMDALGAWSTWAYSTFDLSVAYEPEPGEAPLLSGYARKAAQWRIVLYDMGEGRGKGGVKAIIDDAHNIGASMLTNDIGEFYFTLRAEHPQASECEPYQRHYSFQQYRGSTWVPLFEGILTDFDADEDELVVYGVDYLGLLSLSVDVRASQGKKPNLPVAKGGSKYVNKRLSWIIREQLKQAKGQDDSHVGFIDVKATEFDKVVEKATIFSSYKQRLEFIRGLIASAKQGTGRRTRLWPVRLDESNYVWRFRLDAGTDRDNLRLTFGELVQGYRVLAMGDFATRLHGVGVIYNESKARYFSKDAPGIDTATWGLTQRVAFWRDLNDKSDIKRRVRQQIAEMGKVGKRVALGLRVTGIEPFDGWNLQDSVPVVIDHGAVDTEKYGSGYWTIYGVEYRVFPDGYDELTLIVTPKEDDVAPDDDIIDSDPIKPPEQWESGPGKPTCANYGDFYFNTENGVTYKRCDDSAYCYCPIDPPQPYAGRVPESYDDFGRLYGSGIEGVDGPIPHLLEVTSVTIPAGTSADPSTPEYFEFQLPASLNFDTDTEGAPADMSRALVLVRISESGYDDWYFPGTFTSPDGFYMKPVLSGGSQPNGGGSGGYRVAGTHQTFFKMFRHGEYAELGGKTYIAAGGTEDTAQGATTLLMLVYDGVSSVQGNTPASDPTNSHRTLTMPEYRQPDLRTTDAGPIKYLGIGVCIGGPTEDPPGWESLLTSVPAGTIAARIAELDGNGDGFAEASFVGDESVSSANIALAIRGRSEPRQAYGKAWTYWTYDKATSWTIPLPDYVEEGGTLVMCVGYNSGATMYTPDPWYMCRSDNMTNYAETRIYAAITSEVLEDNPERVVKLTASGDPTVLWAMFQYIPNVATDRYLSSGEKNHTSDSEWPIPTPYTTSGGEPGSDVMWVHCLVSNYRYVALLEPEGSVMRAHAAEFKTSTWGAMATQIQRADELDPLAWMNDTADGGTVREWVSFVVAVPGEYPLPSEWGYTPVLTEDVNDFTGDQPYTDEGKSANTPLMGVDGDFGFVESEENGYATATLGIGENTDLAPWNFENWGFVMRFRITEGGSPVATGNRLAMLKWQRDGQVIAPYVTFGDKDRHPGVGIDPLGEIPPSKDAEHVQVPVEKNVWMYARFWFSMTKCKAKLWREDAELGEPKDWMIDYVTSPLVLEDDETGDGFPPVPGDPPDPEEIPDEDEPYSALRQSLDFIIHVGNGAGEDPQRFEIDQWGYYANETLADGTKVDDELVGYGDFFATVFYTDAPYVEGTLEVKMRGLIHTVIESDPATGEFTFDFPPPGGYPLTGLPAGDIVASYDIARENVT